MSFRYWSGRRNAYRGQPPAPASAVDRVADGYLTNALANGHLRRLLSGRLDAYRRTMTSFLATSCDRTTEMRAADLLRTAHQDMPIAASDYELVGYYLLGAAGRYDLPVVTQATIAGAFGLARAQVLGRSDPGLRAADPLPHR